MKEKLSVHHMKAFKIETSRFIMPYKFAVDEINTKINILKEEFTHLHDYNPIEYVTSRVKTFESIMKKISRKNIDLSFEAIRREIRDIAGVRVTCSFTSDIYRIMDMLERQKDIQVLEIKDYFKNPKPNGYRSLHMLIEIPIFMSDRVEHIPVEIQIRTIAMDFWASLEHKIFYKYNKDIPQTLIDELRDAATIATKLDEKMERLNQDINVYKEKDKVLEDNDLQTLLDNDDFKLPNKLIESIIESAK